MFCDIIFSYGYVYFTMHAIYSNEWILMPSPKMSSNHNWALSNIIVDIWLNECRLTAEAAT